MAKWIRIITDLETARQTVFRRRPWDEMQVSPDLQSSITRIFGEPLSPDQVVARILSDVRRMGDRAVLDYGQRIDGVRLDALRVTEAESDAAWERTPAELRQALEVAADRIATFHSRQYRQSWIEWDSEGGALGQIVRPLQRVGIYAPGGRALYPSSLLMAAVPARVAGVEEVIVSSPPQPDGCVGEVILAAARVAGVDTVVKAGGAQAIAALAYGTESIPRVDKIVGPGNLFVVLAKRQVYGQVAIDGLPGPTETLVIADDSADPAWVAADLLAQAEHDVLATPICITPSSALAGQVQAQVACQAESLEHHDAAAQSLEGQGGIVVVADLAQAIEVANEFAPEHLCLAVRDPWAWVGRVRNAAGVFVGEMASEALGDYVVGPSHIMPTGGTARFASPCNVWDFVKLISVFAPSGETARRLAPAGTTLARAEGLAAHAGAIQMRLHSRG